MRGLLRDRGGFAYLMVMVAAALFAAAGAGYFAVSSMHQRVGAAYAGGIEALYLAEWGLEYGVYKLKNEVGSTEWAGVTNLAVGKGTVTVTVNRSPLRPDGIDFGQVELSSTGAVGGKYARTVKRRFQIYPSMFGLALYSQNSYVNSGSGTSITGGWAVATFPEFPSVRWTRLQALATQSWGSGQTWLVPLLTYDGIFYFGGDLKVSALSILAKGSLFVRGNFDTTTLIGNGFQATISRTRVTYPATIIVDGACTFNASNVTINGRVFCNGQVDIQGDNVTINGGLYSAERIRVKTGASNFTLNYRPAVVENADEYFYFNASPTRVVKAAPGGWTQVMQ